MVQSTSTRPTPQNATTGRPTTPAHRDASSPSTPPPVAENRPAGLAAGSGQPIPVPTPPPATRPAIGPSMHGIINDRMLLDQLRNIYQTANRHEPVPSDAGLDTNLVSALEDIARMASAAVKEYKPK